MNSPYHDRLVSLTRVEMDIEWRGTVLIIESMTNVVYSFPTEMPGAPALLIEGFLVPMEPAQFTHGDDALDRFLASLGYRHRGAPGPQRLALDEERGVCSENSLPVKTLYGDGWLVWNAGVEGHA